MTFYCDYIYQSSGTKYTTHGGSYNVGFISGAFSIGLGGASNYSGVQIGASISFKHYASIIVIIIINQVVRIILFMVVILIVVPFVELLH